MEKSKGSADHGGFRMKREKGRHCEADGIRAPSVLKLRGDIHTNSFKGPISYYLRRRRECGRTSVNVIVSLVYW